MKTQIASLCALATIKGTQANICDTDCDDAHMVKDSCFLPVEGDPTQYVECANGEPYVKQCPGGLIWNDVLLTCDWPPAHYTTAAPWEPETEEPGSGSFFQDANNDEPVPDHSELCDKCSDRERQEWSCFFPAPNPNQYISCGPQDQITMDCPPTLVWCQVLQTCAYPEDPLCDALTYLCETCDERDRMDWSCYFPAKDETKYVACGPNGKANLMDCPEGLIWNNQLEVCDFP